MIVPPESGGAFASIRVEARRDTKPIGVGFMSVLSGRVITLAVDRGEPSAALAILDWLERAAGDRGLADLHLSVDTSEADWIRQNGYSLDEARRSAVPPGVVPMHKTLAGTGTDRPWRIRSSRPEDCGGICAAHIESIKALCAPHYRPEHIEAWLEGKTPALYAPLLAKYRWYVAEESGRILGFGSLDAADAAAGQGEICGLYFSPRGAGRGVGLAMMRRLESIAIELGVRTLKVNGTTNAAPFYAKFGFVTIARTTHRTRSGIELPSVAMVKQLDA